MEKELMTRAEVCEMLGIKYVTLHKYIKHCGLPYVEWDFGRKRFLRSSILSWIKSNEKQNSHSVVNPPQGRYTTSRMEATNFESQCSE